MFVKRVFTEEERQEIVSRYPKEPIQKIALSMGIWTPNVRKILVEEGIQIRQNKHPDELAEQIRYFFENTSLTRKEICQRIGKGQKMYDRLVKKFGLKRKYGIRYEKKNNRSFLECWTEKYGADKAAIMWEECLSKHRANSSGKNNPMYGKSTPQGAGNGWKGWYDGHYFRSLRELCFMIRMKKEGKSWTNGEKISINYDFMGTDRTYRPDFVIDNNIYEIKPARLMRTPQVQAKKIAAEKFCQENGYIYNLIDEPLDFKSIGYELFGKKLKFAEGYGRRFMVFTFQQMGFIGKIKTSKKKPEEILSKEEEDESLDWWSLSAPLPNNSSFKDVLAYYGVNQ